MGKPISEKHAIDVASFIVLFERPFEAKVIDSLRGLHELLKADYPHFNPTTTMEVRVTGSEVNQQVGITSGCLLQNFRPDGRPSWTLRVEGNAIVVSCMEYDRWKGASNKALSHIKAALALVNNETNAIVGVILQVVDRFVTANGDDYHIEQVFNNQSRYLTKQALAAGKFWHVYQGWFDSVPELGGQLLNVLNLSTAEGPAGLTTSIDHTANMQFQSPKASSELDDIFTPKVFGALHESNKAVIRDLLNIKQREAIKL